MPLNRADLMMLVIAAGARLIVGNGAVEIVAVLFLVRILVFEGGFAAALPDPHDPI